MKCLIALVCLIAIQTQAQVSLGYSHINTGTNYRDFIYITNLPPGTHALEISFNLPAGFQSFAPITSNGTVTVFSHFVSYNIGRVFYRVRVVDQESQTEQQNIDSGVSIEELWEEQQCNQSYTNGYQLLDSQSESLEELLVWSAQRSCYLIVLMPPKPKIVKLDRN